MDQAGRNHGWYISNGRLKIKIQENGLIQHIPDFDFSFGGNIRLYLCQCSILISCL